MYLPNVPEHELVYMAKTGMQVLTENLLRRSIVCTVPDHSFLYNGDFGPVQLMQDLRDLLKKYGYHATIVMREKKWTVFNSLFAQSATRQAYKEANNP